jgi:hypothetical protein
MDGEPESEMAFMTSKVAVRERSASQAAKRHSKADAGNDRIPSERASAWALPEHPESIPAEREIAGGRFRDDAAQGAEQASGGDTGATGLTNQQMGGQQLQQPTGGVPRAGKVTAVTLISSPTGALSGFPSIPNVPDLNTPGPFNDTTTGACQNVQQIRFDLTGIPNNEVDLLRTKDGVAGPVGQEQPRKGPDGPSDPTKLRQNSLIAVADTPGISRATSGFPLRYAMNFQLFAFDIVSHAIMAKATYKVNILKQSVGDTKPVNELVNFQSTIL